MKQVLRIVLILALVLLPFTPLDAYADEDPLDARDDDDTLEILLVSVGIAALFVGFLILRDFILSANRDEQETLLAEQIEQLEPIENVVPQTNFTPTENANVHGALYPVFEW